MTPMRLLLPTSVTGVPPQYSVSRPTAPPRATVASASRKALVRFEKSALAAWLGYPGLIRKKPLRCESKRLFCKRACSP